MDTKKLRQKILELAIHGKLVPQDPNDEPASVLLERIRAEKERLIKEGKIKRGKKSASDTPHYENRQVGEANEVPEGWEWQKLGDIGVWQSGATPSRLNKDYYGGDIPWLKTGDLNDGFIYEIPETITQKALEETSVRLNPAGSVLIAMYGATIGKVGILTFPATTNQACCACVDYQGIEQMYLFYFLLSHKEEFLLLGGGGAQPNISKEKIVDTFIPIPPLLEQKRIVNAIEQWFNLIESLETAKDDLQTSIAHAKSKILDLAIHGKLVPQDPNDEPAIELLKRINPKLTPCDNAHYENVPSSWIKVPLGNICTLNEGEPITDKEYLYIDVKGLRTSNFASKQSGKYVPVGTTLILVDGENSGEVFYTPVEGYQGSTMKVLNIDSNMNTQYVLYFVNLHQRALRENKVGSAIPHLNKKMFRELIIPIPPISEQERIVEAILQYYRLLDNISANL